MVHPRHLTLVLSVALVVWLVSLPGCSDEPSSSNRPELPDAVTDGADFDPVDDIDDGDVGDTSDAPIEDGLADVETGGIDADFDGICSICHGDSDTPAPPLGVNGETTTDATAVGAHRSHLEGSTWRADVACDDCHLVPSGVGSVGHVDSGPPAELVFGELAAAQGATPQWTGTTCSGVYCHGATLDAGGSAIEPVWTTVDGSQSVCSSCHGFPPGGGHPDNTACATCHETMNTDSSFANPDLHIDGVLQVSGGSHPEGWSSPDQHGTAFNADGPSACTSCHGELLDGGSSGVSCETCHSNWQDDCTFCHGGVDNATGAPPEGVGGETDRGILVVGAHTSHVEATSMHAAWDCDTCHTLPTSALSAGHIDGDGAAEVDFDALNPSGSYNDTTGACTTMYCHGNGQTSGAAPNWDTDPTLDCASCHDDITQVQLDLELSGEHKKHLEVMGVNCGICHADTVTGSSTIVGPGVHVDGTIQVAFAGAFAMTHDGNQCAGTCHGKYHDNWTW